jgi:hypothetical protein
VCLARALLQMNRWVVPDPALAVSYLLREGYRPGRLIASGRRDLAARFEAGYLVQGRLISYDLRAAEDRTRFEIEADGRGNRPSPDWAVQQPLYLALTLVENSSGRVLAADASYLEPEGATGLFGRARKIMMSHRLQKETDRLARRLLSRKEL